MTPTAPASRQALRLVAASLILLGLGPAAFVHAQRGPANPPAGARPASGAKPAPAPTPTPATESPKPSDILDDRPGFEPDPAALADLLGPEFVSRGQGIALRPPKDSVAVRRAGAADFVEFVNPEKNWTLKVTKIKLQANGSLTAVRDREGNLHPGMLEHTATRLKEELPDAEFLRQEAIPLAAGRAAMVVLRHARNLKPLLSQQAIIERNAREYYLIALTTPGAPAQAAQDVAAAGERLAFETFGQVLDSVRLLDGEELRAEQDARLFATRAMLANLLAGNRIRASLVKEQWRRVLKRGKDIGYLVIFERVPDPKDRRDGVEVAIRSRMMPSPDLQVDSGSVFYATMDLRHEDWSTLTEYVNVKQRAAQPKDYKPPQIAEFGMSDRRAVLGRGDEFTLNVTFESTNEQLEPVARPLPPFYIPQAIAHLLPRLLPLNEPKALLFTTWVPESREVILRYVDIRESQRVNFNGELVRCVPVDERIGLDGAITTHYVAHTGQWLGSENKESAITVLPTTEEALLKIWKDADLGRPEGPVRNAIQAAGPPAPRGAGDAAAGESAEEVPRTAPRVGERRGTSRQPQGR